MKNAMESILDPQLHLRDELIRRRRQVTFAERRLLETVAECDRSELWRGAGHADIAHWMSDALDISTWKARRFVDTSHRLEELPELAHALETGELSLDKVVELARFASPEDSASLIAWAQRVPVRAVRKRGDRAKRLPLKQVQAVDRDLYLDLSWYDDGSAMFYQGILPAHEAAVFVAALERTGEALPDDPVKDLPFDVSLRRRRAAALVALASHQIAHDPDVDRATVVVTADVAVLAHNTGSAEIDGGGLLAPETARRLACDCRLEVEATENGKPIGIGRASRVVPPWMLRALRRRQHDCCGFPNCPRKKGLHAHHIRHWAHGGRTDLDNLILVCPLHHKLVHEYRWKVFLEPDGSGRWYPPNRTKHDRYWLAPHPDRAPPRAA